jgi:hypothetical protein
LMFSSLFSPLVVCLVKDNISCNAGDCHTTGKTPVVRNDTHYDYL